jgi:uncharacterized repeat protein (TIGR01451 family)
MADYNPNAVWTSKKKKVNYTPPESYHPPQVPDRPATAPRDPENSGGNGKKVAIIAAIAIVIIGGGIGALLFLNRPAPAPAVSLDFAAPNEVAAGDPFTLSVLYTNSSTVPLTNASLVVSLPQGFFFVGQPESQTVETIAIGGVAPGYSGTESVQLLAVANDNTVSQVHAALSYATAASRGRTFSTSATANVAIGSPVLALAIAAPTNVFAGQSFTSVISYKNTAGHAIDGASITLQYPQGFTFVAADPAPAFPGNTTWNLGSVPQGGSGSVTITGTMTGQSTALYSLSGTASESVGGSSYTIAAQAENIAITASPLTIGASLNNQPNYLATLGDNLDYTITYANTSNMTFRNVVVTAVLNGSMFDLGSVQTQGAFNSNTNTVTWYAANTPALSSLAPGATGSLDLRVNTKPSFPAGKDFTLGLQLVVTSPTVPPGTAATSTSASAAVTNDVLGVVALSASSYRYEPQAAIKNSGPYPPKVNQPTTYTIHWNITNYSTDVSNVAVSAYLQSGATCTGEIVSNVASQPVCDPTTGKVTWTIPNISAGIGVHSAPVEAVFQVEDTPAVNQVGQTITLLGKTSLTATDDFTGTTITSFADPVGTDVPNDTAVTVGDRNVTQ